MIVLDSMARAAPFVRTCFADFGVESTLAAPLTVTGAYQCHEGAPRGASRPRDSGPRPPGGASAAGPHDHGPAPGAALKPNEAAKSRTVDPS